LYILHPLPLHIRVGVQRLSLTQARSLGIRDLSEGPWTPQSPTMPPTFTRTFVVSKDKKHLKDVRLLDGDVPMYTLDRSSDPKIARLVKIEDGARTTLAEVEWKGDKQDLIRFSGGEWQLLHQAWRHYDVTKDVVGSFIDSFTGADGQTYVWHLNGSMKVLSQEGASGPIVAKHVDHRPDGGTLELTPEAYDVGDMLFISFLAQEGYRGRTRRSWLKGFTMQW